MEKIIHYCWFGGNSLPKLAKRCIESWRKFFPDYEIREWNETNFDIACNLYVKEAYKAKKWAFVSDYARFWILYNYGGIYFDTDVEVIKNFDNIINCGNFMGCEFTSNNEINLAPGLGIGAEKKLDIYREILNYYDNIHFIQKNANDTLKTVVEHVTEIMKKHGFLSINKIQKIESIHIYPPEYFCPLNPNTGKLRITSNTYSIHHYTATWQSPYARFKGKLQQLLGPKLTNSIIIFKRKVLNK